MSVASLRSVGYVLEKLAISRRTLKRLMDSHQIAYVNVGTTVGDTYAEARFRDEDIDAFIARRVVPATAERAEQPARPVLVRRGSRAAAASLPGASRYA